MVGKFGVRTSSSFEMIDITGQVRDQLKQFGADNGICVVYTAHTTSGITINENADPDVPVDLLNGLDRIAPLKAGYRHTEGNSAAHIKSTLTGASATLIVDNGTPILGTWQSVFFCEFDGPRSRTVYVKYLRG